MASIGLYVKSTICNKIAHIVHDNFFAHIKLVSWLGYSGCVYVYCILYIHISSSIS